MRKKYFKPTSATWWFSLAPLVLGVIVASEPLHHLDAIVTTIKNATGDAPPYVMINAGLVGIGLRGALG